MPLKRLRSPLLVLLLLASRAAGLPDEAKSRSDAAKAEQIDRLVSQYASYGLFSGAVLVSDHDQVLFKKGYGLANREWNVPNTPDVKFRIGSITKQFTATLVLQQAAQNKIKLDGRLSDYLPYYRKDTGSKVTVHQLLNHTSGIPSYTDDPRFFSEVSRNPYGVQEFVTKFCSGDLEFEPGSKFHYDNSGYFLLGAILEQVTGRPYEALLKENILAPLGMKGTGYDRFGELLAKRATGYQKDLGTIQNAPYLDMTLPYAAGSLYSTVEDLYLWDQSLYTDKILPADAKQKMFTPGLEHYGYGWDITTLPAAEPGGGQTMIAHEGGINGFNTLEQRLVGDHVLVVLFNNTPGVNLEEIATGIRAVLYGREPAAPKRSLVDTLGDTLVRGGVEAALRQYRQLKASDPNGYDFDARQLNRLGNQLVGHKRLADAIAVFQLNAEEFPKSANVFDSLADAYEQNGSKSLAIENYRKSLELDPKNTHAESRLKELQKP
jgi:CubicO group peptidase (beta-lactamase class C family)